MTINKYQQLTCVDCKRRRNLVWDPEHERCYDCFMKRRVENENHVH